MSNETVFIALFRGINVGGHNIIRMAELKTLFGELGFSDAQTYVQSGNVVFRAAAGDRKALAARIGEGVKARFGLAPHIIVLDANDWAGIVSGNAFPDYNEPKNVHAYIFDEVPTAERMAELAGRPKEAGDYAIKGRVLYLHTPDGLLKSNLPVLIERILRVPMTARNWRTVLALQDMVGKATVGK